MKTLIIGTVLALGIPFLTLVAVLELGPDIKHDIIIRTEGE